MTLKGQIRRRNSIVVNLETSEKGGILIENAKPTNHVNHAKESILSTDPV